MTELVIPRSRVGSLGRELGRGGQARVHAAPVLTLPDAPGPLVFKEYRERSVPPHGLRSLVAVRDRLDTAARARLDAFTCWPLRVVEEAGVVRGVVLPLIPSSFIQDRVLLHSKAQHQDPREAQNLLVDPALARRVGMPVPTAEQRLAICRDLAAAVHLVHRLDLVIGDINPRNALFRIPGRPSIMLIDCDSIRIKGSVSVVAQLDAPDWDPPEGSRAGLSQVTDRYKLDLFILRCLTPGKMSSINRDPSRADQALDAEGRAMLRNALGSTPAHRPTAQDWGRYIDGRITTRPRPAPSGTGAAPTATTGNPIRGGLRRDAAGTWRRVP